MKLMSWANYYKIEAQSSDKSLLYRPSPSSPRRHLAPNRSVCHCLEASQTLHIRLTQTKVSLSFVCSKLESSCCRGADFSVFNCCFKIIRAYMRGTVALLPAKYKLKLKQIYPITGSWGKVATSTPKKQVNNDSTGGPITKENAEPIVAFSRPPPFPPVIGPLVALSLLETWSSRDRDDD